MQGPIREAPQRSMVRDQSYGRGLGPFIRDFFLLLCSGKLAQATTLFLAVLGFRAVVTSLCG